ncbi:MAG: hypothetical protein LUC44_00745 [Prevotellaceae bacterium]|nr:hypothetical protein [Prevotellaceae bacterium]
MARQKNDGRGRMGGRAKGTPNKVTSTLREWVSSLIDKNRRQIERDLKELEPKDRLQMLEKLMQYVLPKQQSSTVSIDKLSDEQLQAVVDELTKDIPTDMEELTKN